MIQFVYDFIKLKYVVDRVVNPMIGEGFDRKDMAGSELVFWELLVFKDLEFFWDWDAISLTLHSLHILLLKSHNSV